MKVFKNLFGKGDKIHVDEIAVTPDLLLGSAVIVESGSNEYGEYIRFGNGWQVCISIEYIVDINQVKGSIYCSNYPSISFPKTFIDTDYLSDAKIVNTIEAWGSANSVWTSGCQARGYSHQLRTGDRMKVIAIGKYK